MPTACDLTSTSSGPICGCSMSVTTALCGAWKMRAFMALLGSRRDQHLHLLRHAGGEPLEGRLGLGHAETTGNDALHGEPSRRDLRGDARPVVDAVAPAADDLEVVERPEHRVDLAALDMQPDLDDGAATLDRLDAGPERVTETCALDRDVDAEPVRSLAQLRGDVRRPRIEDVAQVQPPGTLAPRLVRLGQVDGSGTGRRGAERPQPPDRPAAPDEHAVAPSAR